MRAYPRRRKTPMAVQIPQPLKRPNMAAITIPIAAMGNGAAAGSVGGGASTMLNSIKPPKARVARLPAIATAPLARIPIHILAMIAYHCTKRTCRILRYGEAAGFLKIPGGARRTQLELLTGFRSWRR